MFSIKECYLISSYHSATQPTTTHRLGAMKISRSMIVEIENADVLKTLTISKMIGYDDGFKGPLEVQPEFFRKSFEIVIGMEFTSLV